MSKPFNLHDYNIDSYLASGTQGSAYIISDHDNNKFVIKFILFESLAEYNDPRILESRQVLTLLSTIVHPNIIKIYQIGEVNVDSSDYRTILNIVNSHGRGKHSYHSMKINIPYIVMEYIEGHEIGNALMELEQKLHFLQDTMSALRVLEKYNIIHCDINFQNILYDVILDRYVIIDFDYSRFVKPRSLSSNSNNNNNINDIDFVNDSLYTNAFYPEKSYRFVNGMIYINMLPDDNIVNKYINHATSMRASYVTGSSKLRLEHYITILSTLMGEQELVLTIEHDEEERWQYGVRK